MGKKSTFLVVISGFPSTWSFYWFLAWHVYLQFNVYICLLICSFKGKSGCWTEKEIANERLKIYVTNWRNIMGSVCCCFSVSDVGGHAASNDQNHSFCKCFSCCFQNLINKVPVESDFLSAMKFSIFCSYNVWMVHRTI